MRPVIIRDCMSDRQSKCLQLSFEVVADNCSQHASSLRGTAIATIQGVVRRDWCFEFFALDDLHLVAVAVGPIADAVESFRVTMASIQSDFELECTTTTADAATNVKTDSEDSMEIEDVDTDAEACRQASSWRSIMTTKMLSDLKCSSAYDQCQLHYPVPKSFSTSSSSDRTIVDTSNTRSQRGSPVSSAQAFSPFKV
jgi:hypothetical protein